MRFLTTLAFVATHRCMTTCHAMNILALHGSEGSGKDFPDATSAPNAPFEKGNGYAWWTMAPNTRSFTATEYIGFETSRALVTQEFAERKVDLVVAHSQGAILMSALVALHALPYYPSVGMVLNGAAFPNPYTKELENLKFHDDGNKNSPPRRALFVMGANDRINPIESAAQVRNCFECANMDVSTVMHPGGHSYPFDDETAMKAINDWIAEGAP